MADPNLTHKLLILLGDGATPEVFGFPCGATTREVTLINNTGETLVLDCENPMTAQAAMKRWTESQDASLSISGSVALQYFAAWRAWADSGLTKNIRAVLDESAANGGGYWSMPAILQQFTLGQEGKAAATFTGTIVPAGRRTWTNAPA